MNYTNMNYTNRLTTAMAPGANSTRTGGTVNPLQAAVDAATLGVVSQSLALVSGIFYTVSGGLAIVSSTIGLGTSAIAVETSQFSYLLSVGDLAAVREGVGPAGREKGSWRQGVQGTLITSASLPHAFFPFSHNP
jgi:hypothetical protein